MVITIAGENPYEIFESLNSTGLPLEESDLIRNYIFMQVNSDEQDVFHDEYWKPFEDQFAEANGFPAIPMTQFYRSFLMRTGTYSKARETFVDFKEQNRHRDLQPDQQTKELRRFAQYEAWLRRPETCEDEALAERLTQVQALDVTTAHPLLMNLLDKNAAGEIDHETLVGCIDDFCSFVLRRSICGDSTRAYPPDMQERATQLVLEQAEAICGSVAA